MSGYGAYRGRTGSFESSAHTMPPPSMSMPPPSMNNANMFQNSTGGNYRENPAWRTNEDMPPPKRQKMQDGSQVNNSSCEIYVNGLSPNTNQDTLRRYFLRWGQVVDAVIQMDPVSHRGTGQGYIRYLNALMVMNARSAGPHIVDGCTVHLSATFTPSTSNTTSSSEQDCKVFVGGLSANTTTDSLIRYFNNWGQVADGKVMVDPETMRSKLFGYVIFAEKSMAEYVIHAGPHTIDGKQVNTNSTAISPAVPAPQTTSDSTVVDNSPNEMRTVFVYGLSADVTSDTISYYFSSFGRVLETFVKRDSHTQKCSGYAYVLFSNTRAVESVLNTGSHFIDGLQVFVQKKDPTTGEPSNDMVSDEARTLFVGGLNSETSHESVKSYFSNFGKVLKTFIKRDHDTKRSLGYGFILFEEPYIVESILGSGPHFIDGRKVFVNRKDPPSTEDDEVVESDTPEERRTLFIGGLHLDTCHDAVKNYFARFGKVLKTFLKRDQETQKFLGYAYILFAETSAIEAALNSTPHVLEGRSVYVQRKDTLTETGSEAPEEVRTLFVGGLNYETSHETVKHYFNKFGNVQRTYIKRDPESKKSQGYGFVLFSEPYMLGNVFNAAPHMIDGHQVIINYKTAPASKEEVPEEEKTIFIGNLAAGVTHEIVKSYFSTYGKIIKCYVKMDQETKTAAGYAFVTFSEPFMLNNVMNAGEHWLCGQKICVNPKTAPPIFLSSSDTPEEARTIFVAGLDENTTHDDVKSYFNKFGTVLKAFVKMDSGGYKCIGYGFVLFSEPFMLDNVFNARFHKINGKQIFVNRKTTNDNTSEMEVPEEQRTIFVGGLNPETTHDTVKSYFSRFGKVVKTFIKKDPDTQKSQGYAFVAFADPYMVDVVFSTMPHKIDGTQVVINWRTPHSSSGQSDSEIPEDKRTVYFAGVNPNTPHEMVKHYFSNYGKVMRAFMKKEADTQRCLGYGYIIYSEAYMVDNVFNAGPHQIDGRKIFMSRKMSEDALSELSEDTRTIFVGGLNFETNHTTVRKYFSKFGNVEKAFIKMEAESKKSKGYAFVVFTEPHMIYNVFTTMPHTIDGRQVFINWKTSGKDGESDHRSSSMSLPDSNLSGFSGQNNQPFNVGSSQPFPRTQQPFNSGPPQPFSSGPSQPFSSGSSQPFSSGSSQPFSSGPAKPFSGPSQPFPTPPIQPFSSGPSQPFSAGHRPPFNPGFNSQMSPFSNNSSMASSFGGNAPSGGGPPFGGDMGRFHNMQDPFTRWNPNANDQGSKRKEKSSSNNSVDGDKEERDIRFNFLSATHPISCSFCKLVFKGEQEFLEHVSSDDHKTNVTRRVKALNQELSRTYCNNVKQTEAAVKKGSSLKFCTFCLQHYTEDTAKHEKSESHMAMTLEIHPYCSSCSFWPGTLEALERHNCAIPHIRIKFNKMIEEGIIPDVLTIPKKDSPLVLERTCYISFQKGLFCVPCWKFFVKSDTSISAHCDTEEHQVKVKSYILSKKQRIEERGDGDKESEPEDEEGKDGIDPDFE